MKVYKVEIMIIDHDDVGEEIKELIENARYPNHCLSPSVVNLQSIDIGEWDESNPLNSKDQWEEEFRRLFPS